MEFRILISALILLLGLSACTKEVKIDIPGYEEQVVIDGKIETGQPPIVLISKTKDIYSPTSLDSFLNGFQSGAVVTVSNGTDTVVLDEICSDNLPPGTEQIAADLFGISVAELAEYHLCAYTSFNTAIWGEVGKTYSLNVQFEGNTYTSSTTILPPTALDSVFWKEDQDPDPGYGFSYANLTDPLGTFDNFMWEVKRINMVNGEPKDANFTKTYSPVFNDEFFSGKTIEFYYENPMSWQDQGVDNKNKGYYKIGDSVVIKFSKLDKAVFDFYERKYMQLGTSGNPFASPTTIPSNITGGALGVWAGISPSFDTLYCQP